MPPNTALSSLDGDSLIIPQSGALDIQTELGRLLVRQNEICVIPRGIRYRITLPTGQICRGYICELFESHFRLPELGPIGSTGLANNRDFQIPTAYFNGTLSPSNIAVQNNPSETWDIISRQAGKLWKATQTHTPFDVVSWHGTFYPFKYDLARFCVMGNSLFDEHDPCLYTVLTAPSYTSPGSAIVDFAVIPPRWMVSENTFWLPYYHRNTCVEFFGPIINHQDPNYIFNKTGQGFSPFAAGLHPGMTTHGAEEADYQRVREQDTRPKKMQDDGISIFLLETEKPLFLTDWAVKGAAKNPKAKPKGLGAGKL